MLRYRGRRRHGGDLEWQGVVDTPRAGRREAHGDSSRPRAKMSSYLVALAVGHFESVEGEADGIPIRVWGPPGTKQDGCAMRWKSRE